ncbi:uncharacterized protein MYCFIDRAFT_83255 [Pseudocercospora fijiensis CIRAD86]|uniref:Uncharacterized protein n=1 Tax=Pseudocercospora fijiensis (strain CIRAD86) TaxID=383855 RepID=M2ZDY0_PSEFD|nr:uncharacterized protein MYCFIDRAFT_83255 [Pseudocercospora fijiensis CIRAD86]EME77309.1 hypothetical protein MYCFIDRAFT_83255 [Pseudocercospora fijiensis CIRAD86]
MFPRLPEELNELIVSFLDLDDRKTLAAVLHIRESQRFLTWQKLLDGIIKEAVEAEETSATAPSFIGLAKIHTVMLNDHAAPLPDVRDLHLSIRWSSRHNNYWRTDWRRIGRALTTLTLELEHLEFTHPIDEDFGVEQRESQGLAPSGDLDATLAPLGSLKPLKSLRTLTLSTIALFGQHQAEDWPKLETLLPETIEKLECNDRVIAVDPFISRLQKFVIYNCQRNRWISKEGEGALPPKPPRGTRYVWRFEEAMLREIIALPPGQREMGMERLLEMTSDHHGPVVAAHLAQVLDRMIAE